MRVLFSVAVQRQDIMIYRLWPCRHFNLIPTGLFSSKITLNMQTINIYTQNTAHSLTQTHVNIMFGRVRRDSFLLEHIKRIALFNIYISLENWCKHQLALKIKQMKMEKNLSFVLVVVLNFPSQF